MDDNSECNDDEVVLTEDEKEVLLKANNAFTCTLLDIGLKFNLRLKRNILGPFEKYKEETKDFLLRVKLKKKYLEYDLEDQNNKIERLNLELARQQENIGKIPKVLEEKRRNNIGLRTQVEDAKIIEEDMKL